MEGGEFRQRQGRQGRQEIAQSGVARGLDQLAELLDMTGGRTLILVLLGTWFADFGQ